MSHISWYHISSIILIEMILNMASLTSLPTCPHCKTWQFLSKCALSVHMTSSSCHNLSLWSQSSDNKQYNSKISDLNFSSCIFDTINKHHHSGLQWQDNCLMVNPSISQLAASSSHDEEFASNYCNCDPTKEQYIDNASLPSAFIILTTSSSQCNINPLPGIKFGIYLQQVLLLWSWSFS